MSNQVFSAVSQVYLHPLVISTVCDFYTRVTQGGTRLSSSSPVLGLLFGMRDLAGNLTIEETTDILIERGHIDADSGSISYQINEQDLEEKISLWQTVYPHLSIVGWYNFSQDLTPFHQETHSFLVEKFKIMLKTPYLESSFIFLLFNSLFSIDSVASKSSSLPLSIFLREPELWLALPYQVEGTEMEKITLDHLLQAQYSKDLTPSEVILCEWKDSLEVLKSKISLLHTVLLSLKDQLERGETTPQTYSILRSAAKITSALTCLKNSIPKEHQIIHKATENSLLSYSSLYSQIIEVENKAGFSQLLSGFSKVDSLLIDTVGSTKK